MAFAASLSPHMISDVKEALPYDNAAKRWKQAALPYNVALSEALSYDVAASAEALPSISTTEALPHINAIPTKAESLLVNAFSSDPLPYNLVTTPSTAAPLLAQPRENLHANLPPPFLTKIYDMIEDVATNSIISWSSGNNSFIICDLSEFSKCLLPRYFKHNNFSSFVRQLHTYGFKKVNCDCWEFAHAAFLRGHKHLLKDIHRRKPVQKNQPRQQQLHKAVISTSTEPCANVGKFGLEGEIELLKHDKCALAAEIVKLRQQQQSSERETGAMAQKAQMAERRQEQMMIFLAKAIWSPPFVAQLEQQSESLRLDHDGRKKRHLPSGTEEPEALVGVEEQQLLPETGRFDMSSREVTPSFMASLLEHATNGQSTMFSGITSQAQLAIRDRNNISLNFDSATTTRLHGSLEDGSDDLDLDSDTQDFIEEIVLAAENTPPENANMPMHFGAILTTSNIATAGRRACS